MPSHQSTSITFTTASGTAFSTASPWLVMNQFPSPFNVGFGVIKSGNGNVTFRVQHTFDNVLDPNVSARVFTHADVSADTASVDGNYAYPVRAVRVQTVSACASSKLELIVLQSGL